MALSNFFLNYTPARAVKVQAITDFLTDACTHVLIEVEKMISNFVSRQPWALFFNGSKTSDSTEVKIVIKSSEGRSFLFSFKLNFECSNNSAECKALIIGIEILNELGAQDVKMIDNSQTVIKQVIEEYRCKNSNLLNYLNNTTDLLRTFKNAKLLVHWNDRENDLAQAISEYKESIQTS